MSTVNVSTEVKAIVERHAKLICEKAAVKLDSFNQDLNAYAVARSLKEIGVTWEDSKAMNEKVLQVLKKGGNASALRQAISETKKKTEASTEIVDELLNMEE